MIAQFRRLVAGLLILTLAAPFQAHAVLVVTDAAIDHQRIGSLLERALGYTKVFPFTKPIR